MAGSTGNYITSLSYAPHGAVTEKALGNGLVDRTSYNNRLQPDSLSLSMSQSSLWLLRNEFRSLPGSTDNNGNIWKQTLTLPGLSGPISVTYGYDRINRLATFSESNPLNSSIASQSYGYDRWGNRATIAYTYLPQGSNPVTSLASFNTGNNRQPGTFDDSGNLKSDGLRTHSYDAEGLMTSSTGGSTTTVFAYDGNGLRVRKTTGSTTGVYVYDANSKLIAEYGGVASVGLNGTNYITADHLGSTRVVTDSTGSPKARYDYLPFGETFDAPVSSRNLVTGYDQGVSALGFKFTGKERDAETRLDYFGARYYSGELGRFITGDAPFADQQPSIPQSWNLYSYGRNNPVRFIDIDGNATASSIGWSAVRGFGSGVWDSLKGTASAIRHPIDTLDGISATIEGGIRAGVSLGSDLIKDPRKTFDEVRGGIGLSTQEFLDKPIEEQIYSLWHTVGLTEGSIVQGAAVTKSWSWLKGPECCLYQDITSPGARMANRATNISAREFEKQLLEGGWAKAVGRGGTTFSKDGARYFLRQGAKSTGGPTADYYMPGSKTADLKLRFK